MALQNKTQHFFGNESSILPEYSPELKDQTISNRSEIDIQSYPISPDKPNPQSAFKSYKEKEEEFISIVEG